MAYAKKLTGPYSAPGAPITGNYWAEGPAALQADKHWIVYFDKYTQHKYGAITSTNLIDWSDVSNQISLPTGIRHGTIITVNNEVFNLLLKQ